METYIALYRGEVIERAKPLAVAVDPETVEFVARRLLDLDRREPPEEDPVQAALRKGRRAALRAALQEAQRFRIVEGLPSP